MTREPEEWWLENAEERNAAAPDGFFIPPREKRMSLEPGDLVKLLFACESTDPRAPTVERMWVEVTSAEREGYIGTLANRPDRISSLSEGDLIAFGPEHVAAFDWTPEELGYDAGLFAWSRKDSSAPRGMRPRQVAMRPSDERAQNGDSGWVLGRGDESRDDFANPDLFAWADLGWLTDLHPQLDPVFRSGEGVWRWDDEEGTYRRVDIAGCHS